MQTEDGYVTMDAIPPATKRLRSLLRDTGFYDTKHAGERCAAGERSVFLPDTLFFWHCNVVVHVTIFPNESVVFRRQGRAGTSQRFQGIVHLDDPHASFALKKLINDFFSFGAVVNEFGEKIIAAEGGCDETGLDEPLAHATCGGRVLSGDISDTHKALVCQLCNLRVPIPKGLGHLGSLRRHFKQFNP